MSDEPRQDETPPADSNEAEDAQTKGGAFEEALDAAEVFAELADEAARPVPGAGDTGVEESALPDEAAFADDFDLATKPGTDAERLLAEALDDGLAGAGPAAVALDDDDPTARIEPVPTEGAAVAMAGEARHSIGMLFKPVVKHSPPSKIRVEADSVGALFRRFIVRADWGGEANRVGQADGVG